MNQDVGEQLHGPPVGQIHSPGCQGWFFRFRQSGWRWPRSQDAKRLRYRYDGTRRNEAYGSAKCLPGLLSPDRQPASGKESVCRVVQAETGPPVQLEVRGNQIRQAGVVIVLRAVVV